MTQGPIGMLADFIASPEGELYGRYCAHYGLRPGAPFSDDVLAFQVDMAYMIREPWATPVEAPPPGERGQVVTDLEQQIRRMQ